MNNAELLSSAGVCDKCSVIPDSSKWCTKCWNRMYFNASVGRSDKETNKLCVRCGFSMRRARQTTVLCEKCKDTINARYLSWKRRNGRFLKKDVRFRDVLRSALWHQSPLVWDVDVRSVLVKALGNGEGKVRANGPLKRLVDFHVTKWKPRKVSENPLGNVCPFCEIRIHRDWISCKVCKPRLMEIEGRVCPCGGFKRPTEVICTPCSTNSTQPTMEELFGYSEKSS